MKKFLFFPFLFFSIWAQAQSIADPTTYLNDLKSEMQIEWPKNRTINIAEEVYESFRKDPAAWVNSHLIFQ
jgi:hypothetical protein